MYCLLVFYFTHYLCQCTFLLAKLGKFIVMSKKDLKKNYKKNNIKHGNILNGSYVKNLEKRTSASYQNSNSISRCSCLLPSMVVKAGHWKNNWKSAFKALKCLRRLLIFLKQKKKTNEYMRLTIGKKVGRQEYLLSIVKSRKMELEGRQICLLLKFVGHVNQSVNY